MVARESVKARMAGEHGISYTEFSYMLLQAHDYDHLHQTEQCELQIGGSDQWGNILSGVDLIRRRRGAAVHALCWPLITAADGTKVGKTTGARVWLDPDLTSPYAFFQHWINTDDAEVRRMLAQFTLLPMVEVDALLAEHAGDPAARGPNECSPGRSPSSCTASAARAAEQASDVLFGSDPREASPDALAAVARGGAVHHAGPGESLADGVDLAPVLLRTQLASSQGDARRQLEQRGLAVNGEKVDPGRRLGEDDLLAGRWVLLRKGKKGWAVLDARPSS